MLPPLILSIESPLKPRKQILEFLCIFEKRAVDPKTKEEPPNLPAHALTKVLTALFSKDGDELRFVRL
ncbi:uncharacterized protein PFLUO_LOCUS4063 [Penicillium psychrofluorescens]|uniref:uncharacterized protein n=1 Tax=Penicillium psychrofluorescens TaxID=3158075 RepID=UPI003CCCC52B